LLLRLELEVLMQHLIIAAILQMACKPKYFGFIYYILELVLVQVRIVRVVRRGVRVLKVVQVQDRVRVQVRVRVRVRVLVRVRIRV
jgi:hypothetical protein